MIELFGKVPLGGLDDKEQSQVKVSMVETKHIAFFTMKSIFYNSPPETI